MKRTTSNQAKPTKVLAKVILSAGYGVHDGVILNVLDRVIEKLDQDAAAYDIEWLVANGVDRLQGHQIGFLKIWNSSA